MTTTKAIRAARPSWLSLPALLAALCWMPGAGSGAELPERGFAYRCDRIAAGPWSVHVVTVSRSHPELGLQTTLAGGRQIGLAPLSEQMRLFPRELGRPIAAVNGDYYWDDGSLVGDPKGLLIMHGELVSAPCGWSCFWIDAAGEPQMTNVNSRFEATWNTGGRTPFGLNEECAGDAAVLYTTAVGDSTRTRGGLDIVLEGSGEGAWLPLAAGRTYTARVREVTADGNAPLTPGTVVLALGAKLQGELPPPRAGDRVTLSMATVPDLTGVDMAIGGGPALVRDGKAVPREEVRVRNPRTAVGWDRDHYYLVEVDGRQRHVSVGMTTEELSDYLVGLGCEGAMSLDGGGSATCWFYGQVMNQPSEGFERDMANALVVVRKKPVD